MPPEEDEAGDVVSPEQGVELDEGVREQSGGLTEVLLVHEGPVTERPPPRDQHRERLVHQVGAEAQPPEGHGEGGQEQGEHDGDESSAPVTARPRAEGPAPALSAGALIGTVRSEPEDERQHEVPRHRGEDERVEPVEHPAVPRDAAAGVLDLHVALDQALEEVAQRSGRRRWWRPG